MDGKTVGKRQGRAFFQVRLDFVTVQLGLEFVRGQDHDHISSRHSSRYIANFQAMGFGLGDGRRAGTQTDSHVYTGIIQVAGVGVPLGAVTNDGHFLALDDGKIAILVVIHLHAHSSGSFR